MKEQLKKQIEEILKEMYVKDPQVVLGVPIYSEMGDYSTNVAMLYSKELGRKSLNLAEEIKKELESKHVPHISQIKVVAPGFINFFFDQEFFSKNVSDALLLGEKYGKNKNLDGQKTIIEYTDPNPFKEFHIGHLMSNTIGEAISRITEAQGAEVRRACYQGDVGLHVAKAVWAVKSKKVAGVGWGVAYAVGNKAYEEDENAKKEIIKINKDIYEKSDLEINELYENGRIFSLAYFESIYKKLGTKFDYYFFESETGKFGKEIVEKNVPNIFEKSDGAIVFHGEKYDPSLHTRVFINKEGLPTYESKELGLSKIKYDKYYYDLSVVITGNEINEYFRVLLKAMSLVFPELAEKTKHLSHGMLRLPTGKMSSRTGDVITAESMIEEVKSKVLEKMADREMDENKKSEIAEIVAIGALKFSILKQAIGKDIIFDMEKSVSFEGDSGPYLQYATVRANSILKKAPTHEMAGDSVPENWQTTNLERMIERYPSVVERAGREYSPSHIVTYLVELAGEFNSFYAKHKIIDENDPTSPYKLSLTQSFANIMTSGLNLLGIKVPDMM
jgi:arginyl-tRNA synthetase